MQLVLKELGSPDATNRRNAAFCVGELCKNGGSSVLRYSSNCLKTCLLNFDSKLESQCLFNHRDNLQFASFNLILFPSQLWSSGPASFARFAF